MRAYEADKNTNTLEKFVRDRAACRFHRTPGDLTNGQKHLILTDFVQMKMGEAWRASSQAPPHHFFLSFEYAFSRPTRMAEKALEITEELEHLSAIMGTPYETLLQEEDPPSLGYGTPGRIGAGWMEAPTDDDVSIRGYGLRYRSGFIAQKIIRNRPVESLVRERNGGYFPWEIPTELRYPVHFAEQTYIAEAVDFPIPTEPGQPIRYVRLWDVQDHQEVDMKEFKAGEYVKAYRQSFEPRKLVEFLYPSESQEPGRKLRLMQEYFFASATLQDILRERMPEMTNGMRPFTIYLNEIHPSLAIPELLRILTETYAYSFEEGIHFVEQVFRYGNQVLSDEAFETWPMAMIEDLIPALVPVLRKMQAYVKNDHPVFEGQLPKEQGVIRDEKLILVNLCAYFCTELITYSPSHKKYLEGRLGLVSDTAKDKIRVRRPRLASVNAVCRTAHEMLCAVKDPDVSAGKLAGIKIERKRLFAESLMDFTAQNVNPNSIFAVQIGNFHENNRQLMALLLIADLHRHLLQIPQLDIPETTFFFSGLAYPGYLMATETVHLINAYGKWLRGDTLIENKLNIVFLEEINPEMERELLAVADVYQALRLPRHATLGAYLPEAVLHGAAVISSTNGYTSGLRKKVEGPPSIMQFSEDTAPEEAKQSLQFLMDHKAELGFDPGTIASLLHRYNDGFSVLGSFPDYKRVMTRLLKSYLNEEQWNEDRAKGQRAMLSYLASGGGSLCDGR